MTDKDLIIEQTKKWIIDVVIACNFCPFAAREVKRGTVHYEVLESADDEVVVDRMYKIFQDEQILLILKNLVNPV